MEKFTYATVILSENEYVIGSIMLQLRLMALKSKYGLVVIVPSGFSKAQNDLASFGIVVKPMDSIIYSHPLPDYQSVISPEKIEKFRPVFLKLAVWKLTEYEKVIFLDADLYVVENIDHLFDKKTDFAAAPDLCADTFNSGLMVLTPSMNTFDQMISAMNEIQSYDATDQGFLNQFFSHWYWQNDCRLTGGYNMPILALDILEHYVIYKQKQNDLRVIHFWDIFKPWKKDIPLRSFSSRKYHDMYQQEMKDKIQTQILQKYVKDI